LNRIQRAIRIRKRFRYFWIYSKIFFDKIKKFHNEITQLSP